MITHEYSVKTIYACEDYELTEHLNEMAEEQFELDRIIPRDECHRDLCIIMKRKRRGSKKAENKD